MRDAVAFSSAQLPTEHFNARFSKEMQLSKDTEIAHNEALSSRLRHVYWIGGGSGAGKSTIAKRLADQYGLRLYSTDEMIRDHGRRTPPEERPFVCAFAEMDMNER
jgi:2-phosphoglycerate kinase